MNKIIKFLALGGVIFLCGQYLEGITITGGYRYALLAAVVLAVVNTLVKPILAILTFPITIVTFGIFSFVLTAFMVMLMDYFIDHVYIASFWWALALGLIVSIAGSMIDKLMSKPKRQIKKTNHSTSEFTKYEEVK
jgi:putative membrane protein